MADHDDPHRKIVSKDQSHIPEHSPFFEKAIPALLIGMSVLTVVLILFAIGVLTGIVQF